MCYPRGTFTQLGEKNVLLIIITKNAEFSCHKERQLNKCAEIRSNWAKHNSGRGGHDHQLMAFQTKKPINSKEEKTEHGTNKH